MTPPLPDAARAAFAAPNAPARVGRDGALRLAVERRGAASVMTRCRWTLPLQVLAPLALDDPAAVVSVLNPTGGLVGGDRLAIEVQVGAHAHACLTTPSATRVYRTDVGPAVQSVRLALAAGARLEWVPDHTIPSAGSAFRQSVDVEVGEGATLLLVDAFAAGRVARGEAWRFARLDSALAVRDAPGWLLLDRFALGPDGPGPGLGAAEAHPYFATIVLVADRGVDELIAGVAALAVSGARLGAAPLVRRGALVRCLALDAPALTAAVEGVWALARAAALGLRPLALRKP